MNLAEAVGGRGFRIEGRHGLQELLPSRLREAGPSDGLLLLDIPINPHAELPISQELVRHIH